MNEQSNRPELRGSNRKTVNVWKWAFFFLVFILISLSILFVTRIQPVRINQTTQERMISSEDTIELSTRMNKENTEQLMNTYLAHAAGEDYEGYHISLTDQLEIRGTVDFFGFQVPFSLYLEPYVMENGNIQLRGEGVEVADLSLPVSLVMRLIGNQVDFPNFIAFDSEAQIIAIHLDELTQDYNFDVEMTTINLADSVIELNLRVNEEAMIEQIQLDNMNELDE